MDTDPRIGEEMTDSQFRKLDRALILGKVAIGAIAAYHGLNAVADLAHGEVARAATDTAKTVLRSGLIVLAIDCVRELARPTEGVIKK